jgi:hypothetical protein
MKTNLKIGLLLGIISLLFLVLPGCYTQLQSTRDRDYTDDEGYNSNENSQYYATDTTQVDSGAYYEQQEPAVINNYYGDDGYNPRYRYGFSYYYPSTIWPSAYFGVAYNDPYFYDYYYPSPAIYCGPFYHHYYNPYYSYYPYYDNWYGGSYSYSSGYYNGPVRRPVRNFGASRGTTNSGTINRASTGSDVNAGTQYGRTMGGSNTNLPSGSVPTGLSSGRSVSKSPAAVRSGNRSSSVRSDIRRYAPNATGSSRNAVRSSRNRAPNLTPVNPSTGRRVEPYQGNTQTSTPNVTPSKPSSGRSVQSPGRSTPTPSVSPRPSSAPRSSPAPSSSGGARSSGNSRPGGGRRP